MPIFGVVCKKSYFLRQFVKLTVWYCLNLSARPTETRNQNLRPLPDLFQCHASNGSIRFDKQASVEKCIFRDKLDYLDLYEILIT